MQIAIFFSTKDKVPCGLKSYVIYKFLCADCNASYVGETYRHIYTRTHGYLKTDKNSNIYQFSIKTCNANQFVMRTVFQF